LTEKQKDVTAAIEHKKTWHEEEEGEDPGLSTQDDVLGGGGMRSLTCPSKKNKRRKKGPKARESRTGKHGFHSHQAEVTRTRRGADAPKRKKHK